MTPEAYREFLEQRTTRVETLDAAEMWSTHGPYIYTAEKFTGAPNFYPVYKWRDNYSFSYLALLALKGGMTLRPGFSPEGRETPLAPLEFPDRDIERVGGARRFSNRITDPVAFAEALAGAMIEDMRAVEALNPGARNLVLCGGKDSLNILLMPWKTPPVAVSAAPNYALVRQFVEDNGLGLEVIELRDWVEEDLLEYEIAEAACQVDLHHWRWSPHLRQIAGEHDGASIFWKGQLADVTLTNFWRGYTHLPSKPLSIAMRIHKRLMTYFPKVRSPLDPMVVRHLEESLWLRGAVAQGGHVGFLRSVCDALFLSAYHGPKATEVMFSIDPPKITGADLRVQMGEVLLGKPVRYPEHNPAPGPSHGRENLRSTARLKQALERFGVQTTG